MRFICTLSLLTLLSTALADVEFIAPPAGATLRAGDVVTAQWTGSGNSSRIAELTSYDLYLCAGGDAPDSFEEVATLVKDAPFPQGNSVSFDVSPSAGGNEPNAYFLKMVASGPEKSVVHVSLRFTLTHMTGSFSANVLNGIRSILDSSNDGGELRKRQGGVGPGGAGGAGAGLAVEHTLAGDNSHFSIPYQLQTGPTRYAPIAERPGTAITAKTASRQYPATPYHIATTYLPKPTVSVTISAPVAYSVHSIENPAPPAPQPDARMKRFLERWRD